MLDAVLHALILVRVQLAQAVEVELERDDLGVDRGQLGILAERVERQLRGQVLQARHERDRFGLGVPDLVGIQIEVGEGLRVRASKL